MTKIIFLQNILYEYLGTMYISASLKKVGHDCDILVKGYDKNIVKSAIESDADIIAFSCATGLHKWALKIAKEIKKKTDKLILFGGPHPTFFPEVINKPQVDIICRGEGEEAIVDLANSLDQKKEITKIKNLWVKKHGKVYKNEVRSLVGNLDKIEMPDRELYYSKYKFLRTNSRKPFFTTRGCPYDCTFCFNHSFMKLYQGKGKCVRRRSIKDVIEEIKQVKDKYPLKTVYFQDDTFILDHQWIKKFTKEYKKEINLPFICLIRANLVNEDIIKNLQKGGCEQVFFGIETGNDDLRNKVLKKGVTNKQIIQAAKLLKKYKIKFKTYNILGLPGETLENAFETVRINRQIKSDYPWCSLLQPYPGTEIYNQLIKTGDITKSFSPDDIKQSFFSNTNVTYKREMINLQKLFFYAVKFPSLEPLIKKLIKLKPNKLFDLAFWIGYSYVYIKSENLNIFRTLIFGLRNIKSFFYDS